MGQPFIVEELRVQVKPTDRLRNVGGTSGAESENPGLFCGMFGT